MKRIFSILIFFVSLFLLAVHPASAAPASITNFRWTARNDGDPPFVRIAMDLSHAVKAEAAIDEEGKNFQLILRDTAKGSALHQYEMDERAIDSPLSQKKRRHLFGCPHDKTAEDGKHPRLCLTP